MTSDSKSACLSFARAYGVVAVLCIIAMGAWHTAELHAERECQFFCFDSGYLASRWNRFGACRCMVPRDFAPWSDVRTRATQARIEAAARKARESLDAVRDSEVQP